jgi:hypothetical protein
MSKIGLAGDTGATSTRFALALPDGGMTVPRFYASSDFGLLHDVLEK